jgi:GNAT superfamily N-acetyltransferase
VNPGCLGQRLKLDTAALPVSIESYGGAREHLRELFELAEDSAQALNSYFRAGSVLVARLPSACIAGYVQIVFAECAAQAEIKSVAVLPRHQRCNVGRTLVAAAARLALESACTTLVAATATADIGNLRFYQRLGFRMRSIDRDVFTPAGGYPNGLYANGIAVRDRVWFELCL